MAAAAVASECRSTRFVVWRPCRKARKRLARGAPILNFLSHSVTRGRRMNADNAAGRDHQSTSVTMHQQATTGILGPARRVLFMIALATFLGACGGGGDSASPA